MKINYMLRVQVAASDGTISGSHQLSFAKEADRKSFAKGLMYVGAYRATVAAEWTDVVDLSVDEATHDLINAVKLIDAERKRVK